MRRYMNMHYLYLTDDFAVRPASVDSRQEAERGNQEANSEVVARQTCQ